MSRIPRIAIVDDDLAIREALNDLVRSCGYESRLYPSAEEFLAEGDRKAIDCLIVDVKMPGLSGLELQDVLRREPDCPPIMFMTSYDDVRTRAAAFAGGALAFLSKPVKVDELLTHLEAALKT